MPTVYLVSATVGDHVPGHELADPDCPDVPGLLARPDVIAWMTEIPYGPGQPDELIYLVTEDDKDEIPDGWPVLAISL